MVLLVFLSRATTPRLVRPRAEEVNGLFHLQKRYFEVAERVDAGEANRSGGTSTVV